MNKTLEIAKFEYLKIVKTASFWASTLFFPIFMVVIMGISGFSSYQASKKAEEGTNLSKVYILDEVGVIPDQLMVEPLQRVNSKQEVENEVKEDSNKVLVYFPPNFLETLKYEIYQKDSGDLMRAANVPMMMSTILKASAIESIQDIKVKSILAGDITSETFSYKDGGEVEKQGFDKYILPVLSLLIFFVAVYISSSFLLQSVSAEKENRMIETMLSIVDKKSLMFGKMIGLMGVVLTQLLIWVVMGGLILIVATKYMNVNLPIDLSKIDWSSFPISIFFIITGFIFFGAVMVGVGSIGTGAEDSRNLSSIFIMLSVAPLYVIQSLIMDSGSIVSKVFTYFPFTSHMVLMLRNSLGTLPQNELIIGMILCVVYVVVAIWIAYKLFELGCLMYNRRATTKEMLNFLFKSKRVH